MYINVCETKKKKIKTNFNRELRLFQVTCFCQDFFKIKNAYF